MSSVIHLDLITGLYSKYKIQGAAKNSDSLLKIQRDYNNAIEKVIERQGSLSGFGVAEPVNAVSLKLRLMLFN